MIFLMLIWRLLRSVQYEVTTDKWKNELESCMYSRNTFFIHKSQNLNWNQFKNKSELKSMFISSKQNILKKTKWLEYCKNQT